MSQLEYIGYIAADAEEEEPLRHIFVLLLGDAEPWPSNLALPSKHFALFLACDSDRVNSEHLEAIAAACIDAGVALVCTWGPGCERVHDLFDAAEGVRNPEFTSPMVMTTWHARDSLDSAISTWVFTYHELIEDGFRPTCLSWVACSIGDLALAEGLKQRLADPQSLHDRSMAEFVASLSPEKRADFFADDGDDDGWVVDFAPATGPWSPTSEADAPSGPSA